MLNTKSHMNPRLAITHLPAKRNKLLWWDIGLVVMIALCLTFVLVRSSATLSGVLPTAFLEQRPAAIVDVPPPAPSIGTNQTDLFTALASSDAGVRAQAAYQLGTIHASDAADALLLATYDPDRGVREQATFALGEINAVKAIPRLDELQIVQGNTFIKEAAYQAQEKITRQVAAALNVSRADIQALTVAQDGIAYAVVSDRLYTLNDEGQWFYINHLPDTFSDIAAAPGGQVLYVATQSSGLYRSQDGGETWEYLEFGSQTPTQLAVTAVVIHPENAGQMYIALAAPGANPDHLDALGTFASGDGGKTWTWLNNSPNLSVTRHLVIDRSTPGYLYGLTEDGPWRYTLPGVVPDPN